MGAAGGDGDKRSIREIEGNRYRELEADRAHAWGFRERESPAAGIPTAGKKYTRQTHATTGQTNQLPAHQVVS